MEWCLLFTSSGITFSYVSYHLPRVVPSEPAPVPGRRLMRLCVIGDLPDMRRLRCRLGRSRASRYTGWHRPRQCGRCTMRPSSSLWQADILPALEVRSPRCKTYHYEGIRLLCVQTRKFWQQSRLQYTSLKPTNAPYKTRAAMRSLNTWDPWPIALSDYLYCALSSCTCVLSYSSRSVSAKLSSPFLWTGWHSKVAAAMRVESAEQERLLDTCSLNLRSKCT